MNASEPAPYAPSWYTTTMVQAPARAPLTYDLDVDVCVVGSGSAGSTAAIAAARGGASVLLIDRLPWRAGLAGSSDRRP